MATACLLIERQGNRWRPLAIAPPRQQPSPASDTPAPPVELVGSVVTVRPWAIHPSGTPSPNLVGWLTRTLPPPVARRVVRVHLGELSPHTPTGHSVASVLGEYVAAHGPRLLVTCDEPTRFRTSPLRLAAWGRLFRAQGLRVQEAMP